MKKLMLTLIGLFVSTTLFSQTCIIDAWQCLQNNQAPKAKNFIETCLQNNPDNADVWLMRGNVYLQLYNYDDTKLRKDPNYKVRYPDAVWTANESFVKALQLNSKVEPREKMFSAVYGQSLCAAPLFELGVQAFNSKDYASAEKYFNTASTDFMLGRDTVDASKACYLLAVVYSAQQDQANAKKALIKAVNYKSTSKDVYLALHDIYMSEKDTLNRGKVINKALQVVPAKDLDEIYLLQMSYYADLGQMDKLVPFCEKLIAENPDSVTMISNCANYLSNGGAYAKAEEVLKTALVKFPNDFNLNKQMGYRYFMEAVDNGKLQDVAMAAKDYAKVNQLKAEEKAILQNAHDWVAKAYAINGNDQKNNIMLQQLKVKLLLPVPDDLKAKVDSYRAN